MSGNLTVLKLKLPAMSIAFVFQYFTDYYARGRRDLPMRSYSQRSVDYIECLGVPVV